MRVSEPRRWLPHTRYRADDLSQLRPALRGRGFAAWAICDALSLRGQPPSRADRSASPRRSVGIFRSARAQSPRAGRRRDSDALIGRQETVGTPPRAVGRKPPELAWWARRRVPPRPRLPPCCHRLRAVRAGRRRVAGRDGPQDSLPLAGQARQQREGRRSGQRADRHAGALGRRRRRRRRAGRRGRPATNRALPPPSAKEVEREIGAAPDVVGAGISGGPTPRCVIPVLGSCWERCRRWC
jgi:hypothetical protein